jgi:hypothetical protein
MTKSLRERFSEALKARGEHEVLSKSRRYLTFTRAKGGFFFIGKSGSLRFGPSSSKSAAVGDRFKRMLLGEEE